MVGLYFMSNFRIPSCLGQFGVKLMELRKLQFGIYLEHHCMYWPGEPFLEQEQFEQGGLVGVPVSMSFSVLFSCFCGLGVRQRFI